VATEEEKNMKRFTLLRRRMLIPLALIGTLAAMVAVFVPSASAATAPCNSPSTTPAPGSKVNGGLVVNGTCILINVTVNGGITVDVTGHLSFQGGSVNGGVTVNGGELDLNATTNGAGVPTGTTATINGGINFNAGTGLPFADADIRTATIHGGIDFTGALPFSAPSFCGNDISGSVNFHDLSTGGQITFGDPRLGCAANTIHGSLFLTNVTFQPEVEGNTISGSVFVNATSTELVGNTIGGNVNCSNGAVILPGEAGDGVANACS
jgi:hypothetical protein